MKPCLSLRSELEESTSAASSNTQGKHQSHMQALTLISAFMHEPVRIVETSLKKNAAFLGIQEARRNTVIGRRKITDYFKTFRIEQRQDYLDLIKDDRRSRILATYHFGDYVYGMNTLACLEKPGRRRYVLSHSAANEAYFKNLRAGFGDRAINHSSEIICSQTNASNLSQLLRGGNSTLVLFCDLPAGFGELTEVHFLNRIAKFPKGPALLAISNRTPLLPVINYNDGLNNQIEFATQIEPRLNLDETLQAGVKRITQELVNFFERYFLQYPEQWRYLQNLPLYFLKP